MTRLATVRLAVIGALLAALAATMFVTQRPTADAAGLPSEKQWHRDVAAAMKGGNAYVDSKVRSTPGKLAINFDIDNTSLASHYRYGTAIVEVRSFARHARGEGVALVFNTGRYGADLKKARAELRKAGYRVDQLCGRSSAKEPLVHSKQRCRAHFVSLGYHLIANVGNRATDFAGGDYDRAFRLPNYGNQLS